MINAMLFTKGKNTFQVLLLVLLQWLPTNCQLNQYDTDRELQSGPLQLDCLNYRIRREKLAYQDLSDVVDEVIPYCFRPETDFHEPFAAFDTSSSQQLSFEGLRMASITVQQLFSWSAPMEVAERYQSYLNNQNSITNEYFFNCTPPWFGLQCQYSFEFGGKRSFNDIVKADFRGRTAYPESSDVIVQVPCYVLLRCHRNGQPWCLDWREVCDGSIDCFDDGVDEQFCFDMEKNECKDDEYRCHNGLCISQEFWEDGMGDADCLDRSDEAVDTLYIRSCFQDPTFHCEEHSCRISTNPFSCGDGQCVSKFQDCQNGRHMLLVDSITVKGNLKDDCWTAMICLNGLAKKVNETLCEIWLMHNSTVYAALEQCEPFFQFPTIPLYSDHIRFFYKNLHLRSNINQFLIPDYVCYNQQLCDSIIPDLVHGNQTCLDTNELIFFWDNFASPWVQLMHLIDLKFRSCLISLLNIYNTTKHDADLSLFHCRNSLKVISKHRIMDKMLDCLKEDDEHYPDSCQLNDRYRVKCANSTKCWSPVLKKYACASSQLDIPGEISFQSFCDGIKRYFYDVNRQQHHDEFGCGNWSCDNIYARCDGFWACSDGRDEYNCSSTKCPLGTYACVSPVNYTVICLPSNLVNDGIDHCLGAFDEQVSCRTQSIPRNTSYPFRCWNKTQCLQVSQVCDKQKDCADGDDEDASLCKNQRFKCGQNATHYRNEIEGIFCGLMEAENRRIKYFSVHTSTRYPSSEKGIIGEFNHWSPAHYSLQNNNNPSQVQKNPWPWYCNRGLVVYNRMIEKNNSDNRQCICPPSYYGSQCEYQNQRISLTLRLAADDRHATYAVVIMLMDDTDEQHQIHAYEQFLYVVKDSCSIKLNRYLLFPSRPKNIAHNYSVRIDIFEKNSLSYLGSWHFPIAFLFLPVNRLSVAISVSNPLLQYSSSCLAPCMHGKCVKYINKPKYFCRCFSNWSGIQCDIPINCQTCSNTSTCIGSSNNRPICVCPLNRYGRQCSFTSTCPMNACENNGQCVPADLSILENNHTCICSEGFFGPNCEYWKAKLDVSFDHISIPRYLVAYFFTLSNRFDPIQTILLRKLTLFQSEVTFHIAVPFQLAFIQVDNGLYLAALQQSPKAQISTSITRQQRCVPVEKLLNSTVLQMIPYQRIIHFHWLCQANHDLTCFIDEKYLCLCTNDHHANCLEFNHQKNFTCSSNYYCANDGECLQDHPTCPSTKICLCPNCFFGHQCQFYAKGLGSTLDEILGYEFQRNKKLFEQPLTVTIAAGLTMLIFLIGMINSIFAIITFQRPKSCDMGCGIYLLILSIISMFTMIILQMKFWFLFYSYQDVPNKERILKGNCNGIEIVLKILLSLSSWLNACVAIERALFAFNGVSFDRNRSRKAAIFVSLFLTGMIICLFLPHMLYFQVFEDKMEQRSWCVVRYVGWLAKYTTSIILIHYFLPLLINLGSIMCIILLGARRRSHLEKRQSRWLPIKDQIIMNKHSLISSAILVGLTLPYLIISIVLDCQKSSHLLWFYLIGYFLSFIPSAFIFIIYVVPSSHYRNEFNCFVTQIRRRIEIYRLNRGKF